MSLFLLFFHYRCRFFSYRCFILNACKEFWYFIHKGITPKGLERGLTTTVSSRWSNRQKLPFSIVSRLQMTESMTWEGEDSESNVTPRKWKPSTYVTVLDRQTDRTFTSGKKTKRISNHDWITSIGDICHSVVLQSFVSLHKWEEASATHQLLPCFTCQLDSLIFTSSWFLQNILQQENRGIWIIYLHMQKLLWN